jgi:hypothetical protein
MPLSGWTRRLFEQFLAGTSLQDFPYRDSFTGLIIPVSRVLWGSTCRRWFGLSAALKTLFS